MTNRQVLGARVDPETIQIARKLAKKNYGKESKLGYVVDDAVKTYFTNGNRPAEASAILSTTEEVLIDRLDRRVNSIFDSVIQRMGDLYARTSHDSAANFVMMEDLFLKTGGTKAEVGKLRGDASKIIKKRLESVGAIEDLKDDFINNFNSEEVDKLKLENEQIKQKANNSFRNSKQTIEQLNKDIENLTSEKETIKRWYEGLEKHLRSASRLKNNAALIDEYKQNNPFPGNGLNG